MSDKSLTTTNKGVANIPWGNIPRLELPLEWFDHIKFDSGKPYIQAMCVLADIVAWYKPRPVEDHETGQIVRYERKFKGDRFQAYSAYFEDKFGMSEKQFRDAKDKLISLGLIIYEVKDRYDFETDNGTVTKYNVPFIDLNLQKLYQITLPADWQTERGGMPYRTHPYALQDTPLCPTGHTTDITYTENRSSSLQDLADESVRNGGYPPDPYIGKTLMGTINSRQTVIDAKARKILVESFGLEMAQFHANTARLAEIHGKTVAIEQMGSDNDLFKMQNMTNMLAAVRVDTVEKIDALLTNWLDFASMGKKAKKDGTPPIGSNLTDHASFLRGKGLLDDNGNIAATMGIRNPDGGSACGDGIDYNKLFEQSAEDDVLEVQPGLFS